jgi:hypothetical protein
MPSWAACVNRRGLDAPLVSPLVCSFTSTSATSSPWGVVIDELDHDPVALAADEDVDGDVVVVEVVRADRGVRLTFSFSTAEF